MHDPSIVNARELVCSVSRVELSITAASVIILMTESVIGNTLICVLKYELISAAFFITIVVIVLSAPALILYLKS